MANQATRRQRAMGMVEPDESVPWSRLESGRISLRAYMETCFNSERELWQAELRGLRAELAALKIAILLSDDINKERFDSHNKFREDMNKDRTLFVRKDDLARLEKELDIRFDSFAERIALTLKQQTKDIGDFGKQLGSLDGRWVATTVLGTLLIAIASIGLGILTFLQ